MKTKYYLLCIIFLMLAAATARVQGKEKKMEISISITSPAFKEGEMIPDKYTLNGENISPPLNWADVPLNTKTFAIISDDPDTFGGDWVHWVIYNIPADITGLPENVPPKEVLDNTARQGNNDFPTIGYKGPQPPKGVHRYMFKIYALDIELDLAPGATKQELLKAMEGHILSLGVLMGKYAKK